jgi:ankyrin repeat protein
MKIVREHINEKFVEDSDPVADMGIGIRAQISKFMKEINEEDTDENALAECAKAGKLDWVKFLIAAGAHVHFINDYALRWASRNGHLEIVKELLKAGADVHTDNDWALRYASDNGHLEVVKVLRDHIAKEKKVKKRTVRESLNEKFVEDSDPVADMGIGIEVQIDKFMAKIKEHESWTLVRCAQYGKLEWVKFLINKGVNVNRFNDAALRLAASHGHLEVVKELLKAGADVLAENEFNERAQTALSGAKLNNHKDVVNFLKSYMRAHNLDIVEENLNTPMSSKDGNRPISGSYPLKNINYECTAKERTLKRKRKIKTKNKVKRYE